MDEFFWGSATSAHQVEGGNRNNWTEREHKSANRLAQIAKSKTWPEYILKNYPNPLQEENYISGRACDHYNRYEEDFDLAKKLGHNAYRFSVEWSRIEPEEGKFDEKEIEHYRAVVRALHERGLEPFVTLWHYTIPLWFRDKGGWLNKNSAGYFKRYAEKMVAALPGVNFWITLNEVNMYAVSSYCLGVWPPQRKSFWKYLTAEHNLAKAHKATYSAIKSANPEAQIGVAHNLVYFGRPPAFLRKWWWNRRFLNSIRGYQDFVGVNYYHSDRNMSERMEFRDWPIDPDGFYRVLMDVSKKYKKPIYILENGIADARDQKRAGFIREHIAAMRRAMAEEADVRGYFYWSLLDNFEWSHGFWPRFGLIEVDYKTMARKIRPSAYEYAKICAGGEPPPIS